MRSDTTSGVEGLEKEYKTVAAKDSGLIAGIAGAIGMVAVKSGYVFLLFSCGFLGLDEAAAVMTVNAFTVLLFVLVCAVTGIAVVWLSEGRTLARGSGSGSLVKAGAIAGVTYAVLDAVLAIPKAFSILIGDYPFYFGIGALIRTLIANPAFWLLACIALVLVSGLIFNAVFRGRR